MITTDMSPVIFHYDIKTGAIFYKKQGQVRKVEVLAYWEDKGIVAVRAFDCEGGNEGNKIYTEEEVMTYFQKKIHE